MMSAQIIFIDERSETLQRIGEHEDPCFLFDPLIAVETSEEGIVYFLRLQPMVGMHDWLQ